MTTTGAVTAVPDNAGVVTLSTMQPVVGVALTASLMDADTPVEDSIMWQWSSSATMDGMFTDIDGATMASYTPRDAMEDDPATTDMDEMYAGDVGMYLMATATYNDGHGTGKKAMKTTASAVVAEAQPMTLLERYDVDDVDGMIDEDEMVMPC